MTAFDKHVFLVVDDEAFSRTMVQQMLKRAGAVEVLTAENGFDAIEVLNREPVSVMITDFHMPGLHGLQLLKNVRTGQTAAPRNLICAMLTGHAVRHLVGLAIVLDVDSFLAKPVSPETLTKHLARSFQYRFEPLPADNYDKIDVAHADVFLTGQRKEKEPEKEKAAATVAEEKRAAAEKKIAGEEDFDPYVDIRASAEAVRAARRAVVDQAPEPAAPAPPLPAKPATGEAVRVALSEVPEHAILARDIVGASGTLLLAAGTPFRSRYVRRLQELRDMEGEIENVWIQPL